MKFNNFKKLFLIVLLLSLFKQNSYSQALKTNAISWKKDIASALVEAKARNKMLFVECYSPTCPVCQSMEPIFKLPEIIKKYNTDFINYKLDVGVAEQVKFLDENNIYLPSFPQFLYFDADGKLVHQADVVANAKSFADAANMAANIDKRASSYPSRYTGGERGFDFLIQYASYTRLIKDTTSNIAIGNEIFNIYPKDQLSSETSWKITKKVITDLDNGFARFWFDNSKRAAEFETKEGHNGAESNFFRGLIQNKILGSERNNLTVRNLEDIGVLMGKYGEGQYVDVAIWELKSRALAQENRSEEALKLGDRIFEKFKSQPMSVIYIARVLGEATNIKDSKPFIAKWLDHAGKQTKDDNISAEYFYEVAKFKVAQGDKAGAKSELMKGLGFAQKAKADVSKFNSLMSSI